MSNDIPFEELSWKDKVLVSLKNGPMTIKEIISNNPFLSKEDYNTLNSVRYRLKKERKIEVIGRKKNGGEILSLKDPKASISNVSNSYEYKELEKENKKLKESLKFLNDMFKNNLEFLMEDEGLTSFVISNEDKFNFIEKQINERGTQ